MNIIQFGELSMSLFYRWIVQICRRGGDSNENRHSEATAAGSVADVLDQLGSTEIG